MGPTRPRSLRRPLPPRRDRGGLCRGRSAASGHLLPLGRRLLRGPRRSIARSLAGSAALERWRRRPGLGVRLGSAAFGWARLGSARLGGRQKTAESPASWEARSRRPREGGNISAAATTQLAGFSRLLCHWSCAGAGTGPPLVPEVGGSGKGAEGALLSRSFPKGTRAGAGPTYWQGLPAPSTPGRAAHLTSEKGQNLCTLISEETTPLYLGEVCVPVIWRKSLRPHP